MAYSVTIGRCVAVDSPIHRLDARAKTVCFLACSILSFFINNVPAAIFFGAVAVVLTVLARIPARVLWRTVRPFLVLLVFSFVVNALVLQGGAPLFSLGPITVTVRGVQMGALVAFRTMAALAFGILLVSTTTPVALCDAMESLLKPLRICGLPYQDVAMIFSVALRYIPCWRKRPARWSTPSARVALPRWTEPWRRRARPMRRWWFRCCRRHCAMPNGRPPPSRRAAGRPKTCAPICRCRALLRPM